MTMLTQPNTHADVSGHATIATPAANHPLVGEALKILYGPIVKPLAEVEQLLRDELRNEHGAVDEMLRHGSMLGGKRLRPALMLLAAQATGQVRREHITLAAVVEMIHTATLVHDDILDEADRRRHLATCNAIWDNQASVLLGDYLFTHAFYLASTLETTYGCRTIGRATNVVCEGELRQVRSRGNFDLSEDEYYAIIDAKTARLCECSCQLGAYYAGAGEAEVARLAAYGKHLGIAFQITDDLLDVLGDSAVTGKSLGTDLEKQKLTLPIIYGLAHARGAQRRAIVEILSDVAGNNRDELAEHLAQLGALDYARAAARQHTALAVEQLATLPTSPAREILAQLPEFVTARSA
jgi:octaprenyl-diphosphate synthase